MSRRAMELSIRTRLTLWYTAILLSILVVISGLSYSLLRSRLMQDLDASLLAVGLVVRDTGWSGSGAALGVGPESALREILGPEFYDKFFQLVDPEGRLGARSTHLREETLPLSAQAREEAARGVRTFATVRHEAGEPARLLTLAVTRDGPIVSLLLDRTPPERARRTS